MSRYYIEYERVPNSVCPPFFPEQVAQQAILTSWDDGYLWVSGTIRFDDEDFNTKEEIEEKLVEYFKITDKRFLQIKNINSDR